MTNFPRLVYRAADTYLLTNDEDALAAALAAGWFESVPAALAPKVTIETKAYSDGTSATGLPPLPELSPAEQDALNNAPPTREELKLKAAEIGIEFAPNIPTEKLSALVAAALAPKE